MHALINDTLWEKWLYRAAILATLFIVSLHTSANDKSIDKASTPAQLTLEDNGRLLTLNTSDEQWQITLERVEILGYSASVQRALYDIPYFYRGQILGEEDSWVRLNSTKELPLSQNAIATDLTATGHIFVNDALFQLRHHENDGHVLISNPDISDSTKTLKTIYKTQQGYSPSFTNRREKTSPPKAIKIGVMADSRFNEFYNGRGLAEALSIINGVDGLFQDQLGLAIIVERIKSEEDPDTDPLRSYSGSMEQMLYEFRSIRREDPEFPADLALVHLFTGYSDPNELIGVSWIDTVCQLDGYDISISTPYPYNILLSAHEIAHNLGALHDDDQQCLTDGSITGREIMWSELSNATQTNFSSCSLDTMRQSLTSSCMQDNIDMALTVKTSPTSFLFEQQVEVAAINWDETRASGQVSSITRFPESTLLSNQGAGCVIEGTTLTCQHGNISAYSQSIYSVTALLANSDTALIRSELYLSDFTDSNELDNRANVQVSFTDTATSQAPLVSNLAISNDGNNQAVATGGNSGIGSFGPLGLLWLYMSYCSITFSKRRFSATPL